MVQPLTGRGEQRGREQEPESLHAHRLDWPRGEMTSYRPSHADKFTFGLWTVGNRGRDPFGEFVRPPLDPVDSVRRLGALGAWGVNFHDNDLVPIDATAAERDRIVSSFKTALKDAGM